MRRALVAAGLALSCGDPAPKKLPPLGQIVLFIDTDATVPAAVGSDPRAAEQPFLFDRLRVQILKEGAPLPDTITLAQRDFPLHLGRFATGPVSVGILPPLDDAGLVARVQIFRSDRVVDGEPPVTAQLETHVRLPAVGAEGKQPIFVTLRTSDVGVRVGVGEPIAPSTKIPTTSEVGTWPRALRVPCSGQPGPDEACVPGGAFWMGDPRLRGIPEVGDAADERLVVISPYYIDKAEVIVRQFRTQLGALENAGRLLPPRWDPSSGGGDIDYYATFTIGPSSDDPSDTHADLPVNAAEWSTAVAYCALLGKTLPSEAQYEYLASGLGLERTFVWGNDAEVGCEDVVLSRAGARVYATLPGFCRPEGEPGGALPAGRGARDVVRLPGSSGPVVDLGGNVAELTRDYFVTRAEPPFDQPGLLVDPAASAPGSRGNFRAVVGSSWRSGLEDARVAWRFAQAEAPGNENRSVGFRCVRRGD